MQGMHHKKNVFFSPRTWAGASCGVAALLLGSTLAGHADPFADKSDPFLQQQVAGRTAATAHHAQWGSGNAVATPHHAQWGSGNAAAVTHNPYSVSGTAVISSTAHASTTTSVQMTSVILKLVSPMTVTQQAQLTKAGATIVTDLPVLSSVVVQAPAATVSQLATLPFVVHLSGDVPIHKKDEFTVGSSGAAVAMQSYNVSGTGVGVAVIDSGINDTASHDLLDSRNRTRVLASVSFVPGDPSTADLCGHGTHIAGIISGNGADSTGSSDYHTYKGIAPQSQMVNVRVLDCPGQQHHQHRAGRYPVGDQQPVDLPYPCHQPLARAPDQ